MRRIKRECTGIPFRTQRGVLCDVMLSATECGAWLTLAELTKLTRYPPASISAQLRHLRKPQYGAHVVEKRRRETDEVGRIEEQGTVWEYRLAKEANRAATNWLGDSKRGGGTGKGVPALKS